MAKLKIDFDVLQSTINTYNTEIENFERACAGISKSLNSLRSSGWDSKASKTWFSMLDDDWLKNIQYQIRVLRRLRDNLEIARDEYRDVEEIQKRLGKSLD